MKPFLLRVFGMTVFMGYHLGKANIGGGRPDFLRRCIAPVSLSKSSHLTGPHFYLEKVKPGKNFNMFKYSRVKTIVITLSKYQL